MPAPKKTTLTVLREWLQKADNDLTAARQILKLGNAAPMETIGFHAQQCVEKYLKVVLVERGISVPKTHNIQALMRLIPRSHRPGLAAIEQKQLTNYAAAARYPEAGLDISFAAARKAVALAGRVRREIRQRLPRAALRRREK
jgi:HEPN domain-containing protein